MTTSATTTSNDPHRIPASPLWLTDRSRFRDGTARCPRKRYLNYHAGPTGYGITLRRESLPLATGLWVHHGIELFAQILGTFDRLPSAEETRELVARVCAGYVARVEARGFRGVLSSEATEETITEQRVLIAGLLWAIALKFLPWLHGQYRVRSVEQERLHFLECACGAPPFDPDEHVRRRCAGKALMLRSDLLAERRSGGTLAYFEVKTTGWESEAWAEQWETDPQLALGTLDAEAIWGREVSELYIVGLNKGTRRRDKYDPDERKKQLSPLCYGYARPSNPPLLREDWLPAYEWVTPDGETKRASRAHRRTGVWKLTESDWPTWRAYQASDPAMPPEEFWVRMLPDSVLEKTCFILGPMNRQDTQLRMLLRSMQAEEARWQEALWTLYELQLAGHDWPSAVFQNELDRLIPCSWACRPYGKEHQCEFVPICHRHTGWDDPLANGYQPRLPHHTPELEQAIARGLLPAEAVAVEEEESV